MTSLPRAGAAVFLAILGSLSPCGWAQDLERIPMNGTVNGRPLHLAFDTGAEASLALFSSKTEALGLKIIAPADDVKPEPGGVRVGLTEPAKVEIAGRSFEKVQFYVLDTPPSVNWEIDGLAGWPMFKDYIVLLKVAEQKLTIGLEKVPAEFASWSKFRLRTNLDALVMELPSKPGEQSKAVTIDTGDSAGVSLSPDQWREWKAANPRQPITLTAGYMPGAGTLVQEEAWADELSLNGLVLHGVPVKESNVAQARTAGPGFAASLGLAALARLDLLIDGTTGVLYAHPRTDPAFFYPYNRLGAIFIPRNERSDDLVAHVAAGSPAAMAGVRDDDVLLKIDQVDMTKWRTEPNVLPFSQYNGRDPGTKLVLTLRRGQETVVATAILRDIVAPQ